MAASVPWLQSTLNFFLKRNFDSSVLFPYIKFFHPLKGLVISPCILILSHDHVLSVMSSPVSLIGTDEISAVFLAVCRFPPPYTSVNILVLTGSWYAPFNFKPSCFIWNFPKAYSKANLKSNGDKPSPYFKPLLVGNMSHNIFLTGICSRFCSDTISLALQVSWGYQTDWQYYTRPHCKMNSRFPRSL